MPDVGPPSSTSNGTELMVTAFPALGIERFEPGKKTGGYLTEEHFSSSGESWTSIAPTDLPRLAKQIDRMVSDAGHRC
jgi:hypothetical protein